MMNWQQKRIFLKSETSGFTMIECLIAVLVVSVLMAAIAPVIGLSAANKVQTRRVELASQAARTYINGVLVGTIALPNHVVTSTQSDGKKFADSSINAVPAPSNTLSCGTSATNYPYCSNTTTSSLYCFDLDTSSSGCSSTAGDLIVQAFRRGGDKNFLLGVRVYRADGFDGTALYSSLGSDKKLASTSTSGGGDRKAPLVEMTTEIVNGTSTLKEYCDRLGGCT